MTSESNAVQNGVERQTRFLRASVLLVALSLSVYLWKFNEPLPVENKELYRRMIAAGKQQEAILAVVADLKAYAEAHPDFRPVLDRHPVKKWLDPAP